MIYHFSKFVSVQYTTLNCLNVCVPLNPNPPKVMVLVGGMFGE